MTLCAPRPAGEVPDFRHTGLPAVVDDVSGAELAREPLPVGVSAHRDNAFSAQLVGRQHAEQTDRIVTDDRSRLAGARFGGHRAEPAGAQHIGGGQQAGDQFGGRPLRVDDQGAVGPRDAPVFGLRADAAHRYRVLASALVAGSTDLAGVVRGEERPDHELSRLDRGHVAADFFDDTHVLMTHGVGDLTSSSPRHGHRSLPQIQAAEAITREPDAGSLLVEGI